MGKERVLVPVTDDLLAELMNTEAMIAELDAPHTRLKDKVHYEPAVRQLESLAKAVLSAQASVSLICGPSAGAAIFVQSGGTVAPALDVVIKYLRNDAPALLRHDGGGLSQYEKTNTLNVQSQLKELHGRILWAIRTVADADLKTITDRGAQQLVTTANVIAKIAAGDADGVQTAAGPAEAVQMPAGYTIPGANGARCPVMLTGQGRCTKRAGHLALNPTDACAPN